MLNRTDEERKIDDYLLQHPAIENNFGIIIRELITLFANQKNKQLLTDDLYNQLLGYLYNILVAADTFDTAQMKHIFEELTADGELSKIDHVSVSWRKGIFPFSLFYLLLVAGFASMIALTQGMIFLAVIFACYTAPIVIPLSIEKLSDSERHFSQALERFFSEHELAQIAIAVNMIKVFNSSELPKIQQIYDKTFTLFMYETREMLSTAGVLNNHQPRLTIEEEFLNTLNQYTQKPAETYSGPQNLPKRKELYDDLIIKQKQYIAEIHREFKQKSIKHGYDNIVEISHPIIANIYRKLSATSYILNQLNSEGPINVVEIRKAIKIYFGSDVLDGRRLGFFSNSHLGKVLNEMEKHSSLINQSEVFRTYKSLLTAAA